MRILIVGAGGTGGSFGTLLQEAGRDITYLVRPARAETLRSNGLRFVSPEADRVLPVKTLVAGESSEPFDLVLITVKAGGLESALSDLRPYIHGETKIIPILNGLTHIQRVQEAYPAQVIGGIVKIVGTLDGDVVRQKTDLIGLTIGSLDQAPVPEEVVQALDVPAVNFRLSGSIMQRLWEKWVFIAAAGAITCLFRAPIGRIIEAGGLQAITDGIDELEAVAQAAGFPVSENSHQETIKMLTAQGSAFTSSLYRDVTAGKAHEGEHLLGEMAREARRVKVSTPLLDLALIQIRASTNPLTAGSNQ